jgi:hypothetical protein
MAQRDGFERRGRRLDTLEYLEALILERVVDRARWPAGVRWLRQAGWVIRSVDIILL